MQYFSLGMLIIPDPNHSQALTYLYSHSTTMENSEALEMHYLQLIYLYPANQDTYLSNNPCTIHFTCL